MAETQERAREALAGTMLREGILGGLLAGAIFAVAQMLLAAAMGVSPWTPWAFFASILLGRAALEAAFTPSIFVVGFVTHAILSALFGLLWGAIAKSVAPGIRDNWGPHAAAATIYGLLLWLVNFQVIGRIVYPWVLESGSLAQVLLHAFAFGLPLGLWLCARLRPIELAPRRRRATV